MSYKSGSLRVWLSIVTLVFLGLVVFFLWPDIIKAIGLLSKVNGWILLLLIPAQFISYFAFGEIIYSYLRDKGYLKDAKPIKIARLSLEVNFVDHVFIPSGVAGFTYMVFQLKRYHVKTSMSIMSQMVCYIMRFVAYIAILLPGIIIAMIFGSVNKFIVEVALAICGLAIAAIALSVYLISNLNRMKKFAGLATKIINKIVKFFTIGKKPEILASHTLPTVIEEIHDDYEGIKKNKKLLLKPFMWGAIANISDSAMFLIAFLSFGVFVNPVVIFIAYGLSMIAAAISITPGGAGMYEIIMIAILSAGGVASDVAITGTMIARVLLIIGTIASGYVLYQQTILKYGKSDIKSK